MSVSFTRQTARWARLSFILLSKDRIGKDPFADLDTEACQDNILRIVGRNFKARLPRGIREALSLPGAGEAGPILGGTAEETRHETRGPWHAFRLQRDATRHFILSTGLKLGRGLWELDQLADRVIFTYGLETIASLRSLSNQSWIHL